MPRLFLTRRFQKSFEALDPSTQKRIKEKITELRHDPLAGKALEDELAGDYSSRIGDYRVLYTIEGDDLYLETVRHRRDVYRRPK